MGREADCELCAAPGGELLWRNELCRVVRVADADDFPGFCRVVLNRHVAEMSELPAAEAHALLDAVLATERCLRRLLDPDKINLASLGNVVPHLHWHVIPRWRDDSHFPAPIWAAACRPAPSRPAPDTESLRQALNSELSLCGLMP
jgi:diadenosine tetraphosphate (Ap4A) HIT family hydrolase